VLRIDPAYFTFRAHYRPGEPLTLAGWRDTLPGAVAFINGNFFDTQNHALGLVVADGGVYGQAYQGMGGMLQVQNGGVRVRSTILEPYLGEPLEQAVQAFPMLMTNGQASFANTQGDRISRRTVVGQDIYGRIVLVATTSLVGMRLVDLSNYLALTDLQLVNAVNLDGGGSTLLSLNIPGETPYDVLSLDPVPTVLAVYPR
jgi:exopolysaccharide biosynthesis protein